MKKISEILSDIILEKPFLEEAILNNYLNLTAFSEYIRPYIQKELWKNVSVHAIKMALSRFPKNQEVPIHFLGRGLSQISTRSNLSIMTLVRTPKNIELVTEFMKQKRNNVKHFFTIIEWIHEIDIVFAQDLFLSIQEVFPSHSQLLLVSWLWLITGELGDTEISTPWLFYTITKRLAFHGINIVQVLSTYHELGIIVKEENIKKALLVLMD